MARCDEDLSVETRRHRAGDPNCQNPSPRPAGGGPGMSAAPRPQERDAAKAVPAAARGPVPRSPPPRSTSLQFTAGLARHPRTVLQHAGQAVGEIGRIGLGRSEVAPGPKDKRYKDPAWSGNPLLKRAMQAHLVAAQTATRLVDDAELPYAEDERIRFSVTNIVEALAPSNNPVLNPLTWKTAIDTGGLSAVHGARGAG